MQILEAFDLTGSLRAAADLAGCSHHTVARLVAERDAGGTPPRTCRPRLVDEFLPKIEEWVDNSTVSPGRGFNRIVTDQSSPAPAARARARRAAASTI